MPSCKPFHEVDWDAFSSSWNNEVRMSFHFLQAAAEAAAAATALPSSPSPAAPCARARRSPGAMPAPKQMQILHDRLRAAGSRPRRPRPTLPAAAPARLMPQTDIGAAGVKSYAAYNGTSEAAFLQAMGPGLTPQQVADALLELDRRGAAGRQFHSFPPIG